MEMTFRWFGSSSDPVELYQIWNDSSSYSGQLRGILANSMIFGLDLTQTVLADKIESFLVEELAGAGAVRQTLHNHVGGEKL